MDTSRENISKLSNEDLQAEWERYRAYSFERQRLRGLAQEILRRKSPQRRVRADEIAEGGCRVAKAGAKEVLLAKVQGRLYAIDNACGHLAYPLNQGRLDGFIVTCRWHGARFDVRSGQVVTAGIDVAPLQRFAVKISPDGALEIGGEL